MDPLVAVGLAASIVQFLEFSRKLVSGAVELYQAVDGATSSNTLLERVTRDLNQLCSELESAAKESSGHFMTESEAGLVPLVKSCNSLGRDFLATLEDLKVKGSRKAWASVRQALRCVWNAKDIQRYEKQLDLYRSEVSTRLLTILKQQQDQFLKEQSGMSARVYGVADTLDRLAESHRRLEMSSQNWPDELRKSITSSLRDVLREHGKDQGPAVAFQFPPNLLANLRDLASESILLQRQISFIESLRFPGLVERENNIKKVHPATFEWLFSKESNILEWLRTGTKTFWISGKAGSGKSSLVKFFRNHHKTSAALRNWAGNKRLLIASFFFWNAGNPMQKSQLGLLQTLLYHIFKQAPELIAAVCPSRWRQRLRSNDSWTYEEIQQAFARLKEQQMDSVRFCFFIDGLDEYDGEHADIINIMNEFTCSDAIKICISSRPWNVFESAYGDNNGLKIRLQDLTRGDIARFAEETLAKGRQSLTLKTHDEAYRSLVNEIVDRSDGVFLWVFLVVRSLRRGMTNSDTPIELQARLRELPTELETFFRRILDATEKIYHQQAARLYRVCLVAQYQISALDLAWFAEQDPDFGLRDDLLAISPSQVHALSKATVIRVTVRCQDLLEFANDGFQFLHRTVKDFLDTKDVSAELEARSGKAFNPHNFLCNSTLLQMRLKARLPKPAVIHCDAFNHMSDSFFQHARCLDDRNELNLRLLAELDRSAGEFQRKLDMSHASKMNNGDQLRNYTNIYPSKIEGIYYEKWHHEGWLAEMTAKSGIRSYLTQGIGGTIDVISPIGSVVQMAPLEIALLHMTSEVGPPEVRRLLDEGADPNEKNQEGVSVWKRFVLKLSNRNLKASITRMTELEAQIIETLLLHGADLRIFANEDEYLQFLKKLYGSKAEVLEQIRIGRLPKWVEQQQVIDHEQTTPLNRKRSLCEEPHPRPKQSGYAARKRGKTAVNQSGGLKQPSQRPLAERVSRPTDAVSDRWQRRR